MLYPIALDLVSQGRSRGIALLLGDIMFKKVSRALTSTDYFLHSLAQVQTG
jgi:hypothetical protein